MYTGIWRALNVDVTVYNRTGEKAARWVKEYGGKSAATPAEAAANMDAVLACVGRDEDLREITLGRHGAFVTMKRDAIFVDHTTASAGIARELAEAASQRGIHFVDALCPAASRGAKNGQLTIMCGGGQVVMRAPNRSWPPARGSSRRMGEAGVHSSPRCGQPGPASPTWCSWPKDEFGAQGRA